MPAATAAAVPEPPAVTAVAEAEAPAHTVPLVLFAPFVAPDAPAVPVAGLDAGQAGAAVATAGIGPAQGLSGILEQSPAGRRWRWL